MRPLTEALLRGNSESLTKKGWKPLEQRRIFNKADALLDYIAGVPDEDYMKGMWHTQIRPISVDGLACHLKKGMPSQKMQVQSLQVLQTLLLIGQDLLEQAAWIFKHYPVLFKAKYAASPQAFSKDIHGFFMRGKHVPENSFPSFKTGENPAFSRDKDFITKCIAMYNDPCHGMQEFEKYSRQPDPDDDSYAQWVRNKKAGQKFSDRQLAWQDEINQLALKTKVGLKLTKLELAHHVQMKKQRTI